ncbi:MAG: META domain-containing protein [Saprospiraceae bacterium]
MISTKDLRKSVRLDFFCSILLLLSACTPISTKEQPVDASLRLHDIWVLESIHGQTINPQQLYDNNQPLPRLEPRVRAKTFYGTDGCNDIFGKMRIRENQLRFTDLTGTEKACLNSKLPQAFTTALQKVAQYRIAKLKLYLLNAEGDTVMRLKKVD